MDTDNNQEEYRSWDVQDEGWMDPDEVLTITRRELDQVIATAQKQGLTEARLEGGVIGFILACILGYINRIS